MSASILKLRRGQRRFMRLVEEHRLAAFLARRQYGKTTLFSAIALKKMMKRVNHTVIFGSAKLTLAREIVRKEAAVMQKAIANLRNQVAEKKRLAITDAQTGKTPDQLTEDDFASLFEAQRLEFRYYHSNSVYSRTKVVALLPDTVGETGDLMCDEIGRVRNWREVWEAIEPIISSDPTFRCIFSTTPPPDDTHYSFEMLVPPPGLEFPVNAEGNIYRSEMGIPVLRLDAYDAWADGVPVYDSDKGEPLAPAEHRRRYYNKDSWDRNYGVKFLLGGTGACGLLQLQAAQERGVNECRCFEINSDLDFAEAMTWLAEHVDPLRTIGLGFDVATTTKKTSNPSVLTVGEKDGVQVIIRAVLIWKTRDPDVAIERVDRVLRVIAGRRGGRARCLAQDATNEKYFAEQLRKIFRAQVPVVLVVASEGVEKPGLEKPTNFKEFLGDQYVGLLNDNHLTLPPEVYIKIDHRLVMKDRGMFVCEPDEEGRHGDTFDGGKLAVHALTSNAGMTTMDGVVIGGNQTRQWSPRHTGNLTRV